MKCDFRSRASLSLALLCALALSPAIACASVTFVATAITPVPASSAVSAVTVDKPAGLTSGDVMLALLAQRGGNNPMVISSPAGWMLVLSKDNGSSLIIAIYRKVAGNAEPTSYTWTLQGSDRTAAAIVGYRGVDNTTPVDVSGAQANAASASLTAPSVNADVAGTLLVAFYAVTNGNGSIAPPASPAMNERFDIATGAGPNGVVIEAADATQASAGATGTRVGTSSSSLSSVTALVALRPAAAAGVAGLRITHTVYGIYCLDKAVTITPIDANGNVVAGYVGTINLTTTTGRGTWLAAAGGGVLTDAVADDGAATYAWNASDTSATFLLRYRAGAAVVTANAVDAALSAIRDDGAQGAITFTADGFTVTSAALPTPPPATIPAFASPQTAGSNFLVYLTTYGQTPTDATCGVITSYTGAKILKFWTDYVNPATGTVNATVNGGAVASSEGGAGAQSVTFANGRASVTAKYKDAGGILLGIKDDTSGSPLLPTGVRGNSGTIVMRPGDLVVSEVTTTALVLNPAAATATGSAFVASGAPFRVQVQARDAEGSVTPNFGLETPAEGVRLGASLVLPAGGRNGAGNDGAIGNATAATRTAAGTFTGTTFYWDEVGVVNLRASVADGDYLGSGALTGSLSGNVGRFYPASIVLNAGSTVTAACNGFTYMHQPALGAQFTLEARNAQGTRTQNYDAALLGASAVGSFGITAENGDNGAELSARVTGLVGAWAAGQAVVSTSALRFGRAAAADGPFTALRLGVQLIAPLDSLVIVGADMNPASSGACSGAAPCSARLLGTATTAVYYGRLALRPGSAAETDPLDIPVFTEYFTGADYRPLTLDRCSTYAAAQVSLSSFTDRLTASDTAAAAPGSATALVAGASTAAAPLQLSPPGIGHEGTVRVTLDVPVWLEFPWTAGGSVDPSAVVLFGHYRGHDRIVYRREVH